jgi:hypothetical protein
VSLSDRPFGPTPEPTVTKLRRGGLVERQAPNLRDAQLLKDKSEVRDEADSANATAVKPLKEPQFRRRGDRSAATRLPLEPQYRRPWRRLGEASVGKFGCTAGSERWMGEVRFEHA